MKLAMIFSLAFLCISASAGSHPVGSVIKLLKQLQLTAEKEGKAETATWVKFKKWCTDNGVTLDKAVKSDKADIDTLSDTVSSKEKEQAAAEERISFLSSEIAKYDAEDAQAKKDRDDENKLYKAADKDFESTLTAVSEALKALKASKKASLVQFLGPEHSHQKQAFRMLLQQPLVLEQLSDEQREAFAAAVFGDGEKPVSDADILAKEKYAKSGQTYTFKSGNVIDLLTSLKTHFADARVAATKAETAAVNGYEVSKAARRDAVTAAKKAKGGKTTELAEVKSDKNKAKSGLKDEKSELKSDSKTVADATRTCNIKQTEFNERRSLRRHEIAAMKAAVEILAEVSGVRVAAPKNKRAPSAPKLFFLQLQALSTNDPKVKAVNLLRQEAKEFHSKQLSRFADEVALKLDGPLDSITQMVQKMIFRLMAEQTDEDKHKHWCDLEISNSDASEKDKTEKIKMLDAKIKDAKASEAELVIKIKDLDAKVRKLSKFMADATAVRQEGKKENNLALEDAQAAQAAIAKAEAVLTTYYKNSGMIEKKPWEFLQIDAPAPVKLPKEPTSWGKSYTGVKDPSKAGSGVIAVLKASAADFSKMEAETRAQEISDQKQFDEDMQSAKIDKVASIKESEMKSDEKKRTVDKINSMQKQKKHVASELGAVKQYLKDLKPACVNGDSSYGDRKKARSSEISALRKAQVILQDAFAEKPKLLQISRHA